MLNSEAGLVISAAFLNFVLCCMWFTVFQKKWLAAWKMTERDLNLKDPKPYLVAFIGSLWTSYGLFLVIKHIHPKNAEELIAIAVGAWLLVLVGSSAKHYAFAERSLAAFVIDYSADLIGMILMCFIIGSN
jgi:hypothetical protein